MPMNPFQFVVLATSILAVPAVGTGSAASHLKPNPEIRKLLEPLSGTWAITIQNQPSPSPPNGGESKGTEVWRSGPGGLSAIEEYHSSGAEGDFSGLGVLWWDGKSARYQVLWCSSDNPAGCMLMNRGAHWEGTQLVALHESENGGKKTVFKEVFSDFTATSFRQTLYQGVSADKLKKTVAIVATTLHSGAHLASPSTRQPTMLKLPGPAVQNDMLGTWSLKLLYAPGVKGAESVNGEATEAWRPGPGATSVIEEYSQHDGNESIEEFIPNWWDAQAGGQRFVDCSNTNPEGCYVSKEVARWEGDRNVYTENTSEGSKPVVEREIFQDISSTSMTQMTQRGPSRADLATVITIKATRVASEPAIHDWGRPR